MELCSSASSFSRACQLSLSDQPSRAPAGLVSSISAQALPLGICGTRRGPQAVRCSLQGGGSNAELLYACSHAGCQQGGTCRLPCNACLVCLLHCSLPCSMRQRHCPLVCCCCCCRCPAGGCRTSCCRLRIRCHASCCWFPCPRCTVLCLGVQRCARQLGGRRKQLPQLLAQGWRVLRGGHSASPAGSPARHTQQHFNRC